MPTVNRRRFCVLGATGALAFLAGCRREPGAVQAKTPVTADDVVTIVEFGEGGERGQAVTVAKLVKADVEWKAQLAPLAFDVTRRAGTETPFTSPLLGEHSKGVFRCVCCDTAVFGSDAKFDSGTGWPSFWEAVDPDKVELITDTSHGMVRTEVRCATCGAHLGHLFPDGPQPTGERFCMNSASLDFRK